MLGDLNAEVTRAQRTVLTTIKKVLDLSRGTLVSRDDL